MMQQLEKMWEYAQGVADDEDKDPTPPDFKKVEKEKVEQTGRKINKILKGNDKATPKAKAKARYIKKNFVANLEKYEQQEDSLPGETAIAKQILTLLLCV